MATSRSLSSINMHSGFNIIDEKVFVIQELSVRATVALDLQRAPRDLLTGPVLISEGPWSQIHLTGKRHLNRVVPVQMTHVSQSFTGPRMGSGFQELELEFEGISTFGSGMSTSGAAYSTPQTTDPRKIDTIDVEKAAEEAADLVVATIPAGLPGRDYLVQVAREAALQGAKLALKALAEG